MRRPAEETPPEIIAASLKADDEKTAADNQRTLERIKREAEEAERQRGVI